MAANTINGHGTRLVILHGIWTCVYCSIIVLVLIYFEYLYYIGSYTCLPLILVLLVAECVKLNFNHTIDTTQHEKCSKVKKKLLKKDLRKLFKSAALFLVMFCIYYGVAILFGAPFLNQTEPTFMFSLLLTVLTVIPSCFCVGPDTATDIFCNFGIYRNDVISEMMVHNICFTFFGAWVGAIVIPLDWDRPWQQWPIPCCFGTIIGYFASHVVLLMKTTSKSFCRITTRTEKFKL